MSVDVTVDKSNCSILAPGTSYSGVAVSNYLFISGELTAVEYCTVYYRVSITLVHTLEGGDVAAVGLTVVDRVDLAVYEESGVVSTEDEVGSTCNVAVLYVLTAKEELYGILITEKAGVSENEAVSLNEECKSSVLSIACAEILVEHLDRVPIVGDGDILNNTVNCGISYCYGCGRVGNLLEAARIGNAVERIPLDHGNVRTCALNSKVRNSDLKLFCIFACTNLDYLLSITVSLREEVECLLYSGEYVVAVDYCAYLTGVSLIYLSHIYAVNNGSLCTYYVNGHVCRYTLACLVLVSYGKRLSTCCRRIEAADSVVIDREFKGFLTALCNNGNRETVERKLLTERVGFLEAVVEVYAITCRVRGYLLGSVEAELELGGLIYLHLEGDGSVFLIGYGNLVHACLGHIYLGGIYGNERKVKGIGLSVLEYCIELKRGKVEVGIADEIYLTGIYKLKAALIGYGNAAAELEIEDVDSTALACDSPFALGNVYLDLDNGATAVNSCELDLLRGSVGSSDNYVLSRGTAGAVLNKEGKLTGTGNVDLHTRGLATYLNRLGVLCTLVGSGSGSYLGGGKDNELAVYVILCTCTGLKLTDVEQVADVLEGSTANVALLVTVGICTGACNTAAKIAVVITVAVGALAEHLATYVTKVIVVAIRTFAYYLTAKVAKMITVAILTRGERCAAYVAVVILVVICTYAYNLFAKVTLVVIGIYVLADNLLTDVTLVVLVNIGTRADNSAAKVTRVILVSILTDRKGSTTNVTSVILIVIYTRGEQRAADLTEVRSLGSLTLAKDLAANSALVREESGSTFACSLTAVLTFVISVGIGTLGKLGAAIVTLVILIVIGTLAEYLVTKVAVMILIGITAFA